jgi:hypothetical protein
MRITRLLHNRKVTVSEMVATVKARRCESARGQPVLAIQDTTALRADENGIGLSVHRVIAVDAEDGAMLANPVQYLHPAQHSGGFAQRRLRKCR